MVMSERFLYPVDDWIDFLKACLIHGSAGDDAWYRWVRAVGNPSVLKSTAWSGTKRWWPLLWTTLHRNRIKVPQDLAIVLKSAYIAESIRYAYCRQIADEALSALQEAAFNPVLSKGMALAETIYDQPVLRHCHELDIMIRTGQLTSAAEVLGSDFKFAQSDPASPCPHLDLVHRSGLPVKLRSESSIMEWFRGSNTDPFIYNTRLQCHIFVPELMLCQVCYEADRKGDFPFDWISDGLHLISSSKNRNRDLLNTIELHSNAADIINERLSYLHLMFNDLSSTPQSCDSN